MMAERGDPTLLAADACRPCRWVTTARGRFVSVALFGIGALAMPRAVTWRPLVLWNATASAPIGLYRIDAPHPLAIGETVVARLPTAARAFAAGRHYLPAGIPVVKRIAALGGARVCAIGRRILIDGRLVARRLPRDGAGRPLPGWKGCHRLEVDQVFLIGDGPRSFDSRYFGAVPRANVIGRAVLLWQR